MQIIKRLFYMSLLFLISFGIFSCAKEDNSRWQFSKEDVADFIEISCNIENAEKSGDIALTIDYDITIFNKELTKNDVIVFDGIAAKNHLENDSNKAYVDYETMKKFSVSVSKIVTNTELDGFRIEFPYSSGEYYVFVNKDCSVDDKFMLISMGGEAKGGADTTKTAYQYEKEYANSTEFFQDNIADILDMSIDGIAFGMAFWGGDVSTCICSFTSLLKTFNQMTWNNLDMYVTEKDIYNRLIEVDNEVAALSNQIRQNQNELSTAEACINASVDLNILNQKQSDINSFVTNYKEKIENIIRKVNGLLEDDYKTYVKEPRTIDLYLLKNNLNMVKNNTTTSREVWVSIPEPLVTGDEYKITIEVDEFSSAIKDLRKNNDIISSNFSNALLVDLINACSKYTFEYGLKSSDVAKLLLEKISTDLLGNYYKDKKEAALDFANLVINYADRITGESTSSIIDDYSERLKFMFNFGSEYAPRITSIIANLKTDLLDYSSLASLALLYSKLSTTNLVSSVNKAKKTISEKASSINRIRDNYSFVCKAPITMDFYKAQAFASYSNRGNNPKLKISMSFYISDLANEDLFKTTSLTDSNWISQNELLRIEQRRKILSQIGIERDFSCLIDYLIEHNIITYKSNTVMSKLALLNRLEYDDYRIFTGVSMRDMNSNDQNVYLYCIAKGNDSGSSDYFWHWKGYYRSEYSSSCWKGRIAESKCIDGIGGVISTNSTISCVAYYEESHLFWIANEYWAFANKEKGNYFFGVYKE